MINLLPPEIKNRYKVRSKVFGVATIYIIVLAIIGAGLAGVFFFNLLDQSIISNKESDLSALQNQTKQNDSLTTQAAFVESRVSAASQYQESVLWDETMTKIANFTPTNVQLSSIKIGIDSTKKIATVSMSGSSPDRRSIILFKDKLATEKTYLSPVIQSMSESSATDGEYTFGITFTIKTK